MIRTPELVEALAGQITWSFNKTLLRIAGLDLLPSGAFLLALWGSLEDTRAGGGSLALRSRRLGDLAFYLAA